MQRNSLALFLFLTSLFFFASIAAGADQYSGLWSGQGIRLKIQRTEGQQYAGTLEWQGRTLPLTGQIEGGVFWGEAQAGNTYYSYLVERAGDQLIFVIDSNTYFLDRSGQGAPSKRTAQAEQKKVQEQAGASGMHSPEGLDGTMIFRQVPISDTGGWIGGRAGTFLAPADWKVKASIEWFYHPTMPGRITFQAVSPNGQHAIRMYPHLTYFMGPTVVPMQEGYSEYYGNIYLRPVGDARRMIEQIVLPWIRPRTDYTITGWTDLPGYARVIQEMNSQPGAQSFADGKKARLRYKTGGREVVEDIFAVYAIQQIGPVGYWQAQFISTVTSDAAHIDRMDSIHAVIMDTLEIDLEWFNKYLQISEAFQQLAAMNRDLAANQSRIISQLSDQITENRRQVWENTQRTMDRANRNFSQYIRGVETWENQHGETMELPSGYTQGWQSDDGTVLISDNPNLNPNTNPTFRNKNWHGMRKRGN